MDPNSFITYEGLKKEKRERKQKKKTNKEKAEFQFDSSAAPMSLKTFIHDVLDVEVDVVDTTVEINGFEDQFPMIQEPNIYPSNYDELAPEVLETANNFLEIVEPVEMPIIHTLNSPDVIENITKSMNTLKTVEILSDIDPETMKIRNESPILTAKRLAVKALQLFSFNENYRKHFTMDPIRLRSLNVDMIVDNSIESISWLNQLGTLYSDKIITKIKTVDNSFDSTMTDDQIISNMQPSQYFRALGFSLILKHSKLHLLSESSKPIGQLDQFLMNSGYHEFTFDFILKYFGIVLLGSIPGLDFQLTGLQLIPYYLRKDKEKKVYKLFEDLGLKNGNFFNR